MIKNFLFNLFGFSRIMMFASPADWNTLWGSTSSTPEGATLASAANIVLTHPVHKVSGTTEITLIDAPWTGFKGFVVIIPTGAFTYATGGTEDGVSKPIKTAFTAVANRPHFLYCDGSFWYVMAIA